MSRWENPDIVEVPWYRADLPWARVHNNLGAVTWLRESDDGEQRIGWQEPPDLRVATRWVSALNYARTHIRPRDFVPPRGDGMVRRLLNRETSGRMSRANPRLRMYAAVPRIQRAYRAFRERWPNHAQWTDYDRHLIRERHLARHWSRYGDDDIHPNAWNWEPPGGRNFRGVDRNW